MTRPYNFSAGPATMPEEVLAAAASEMLNWHGSGMGVMEMSHRGSEFISIHEQALANFRELLNIPDHFKVLFLQGGGIGENAIVPLNLSRGAEVDFVLSGSWGEKSYKEASKYAKPHLAASSQQDGYTYLPEPKSWALSSAASYVHLCTNETIHGVECHELPDLKALGSNAPLVIDFSSHVLSRSVDWSKVGCAFAGAQKNIGPAGLTLVVVREDLLGHALQICPSAFNYAMVAKADSMYNTPPTFAIYIAGLIFEWLKQQEEQGLRGVQAIERRNTVKAQMLYDFLDHSAFFVNKVSTADRSRMNVPFYLRDESLNDAFLKGAKDNGLLQLKGHKSVGGMRASIYNAMPVQGVQTLIDYMKEFERSKA
jgi:phosphoserine aminotransferase